MKREFIFHAFFLVIFAILLWQFGLILLPFMTPILGALVLWILAFPLHKRIARFCHSRSIAFQAALSTITVLALVVGPFLLLCWLLFSESESVRPQLQAWGLALDTWRQSNGWMSLPILRWLENVLRRSLGVGRIEFERVAMQLAGSLFSLVSNTGQAVARNAILSLFHLLIVTFTLFFLFRDGERWLAELKKLVPMRGKDKERIVERLKSTVTGLVRGAILTAAAQGFFATLGYFFVGVPAAITMGMLTALAAFIPVVGSSVIWLPISVGFLLHGNVFKGIFIASWGVVIVVALDNFLRSWLIGKEARLPMLFLFFGLLGGVEMYGLKGLLIGPLLVAILPVFVDIYRDLYLRLDE